MTPRPLNGRQQTHFTDAPRLHRQGSSTPEIFIQRTIEVSIPTYVITSQSPFCTLFLRRGKNLHLVDVGISTLLSPNENPIPMCGKNII